LHFAAKNPILAVAANADKQMAVVTLKGEMLLAGDKD
jgi:hypothetical protein